jgi:hypothetical protein
MMNRKNNAKKGPFLAIFGLNLEKEGVFGEGFWWNCVGFMEDLGRKRDQGSRISGKEEEQGGGDWELEAD